MPERRALQELRERAVALRRAGRSRREIQLLLGIRSNAALSDALRGEPPPPWTRRPNAKMEAKARARALRMAGLTYDQIAAELSVSKSSVSLWVRDLPRPSEPGQAEIDRRRAAVAAYCSAEHARRQRARSEVRAAATRALGMPGTRELLVAGAIAYWCEGSKSKPYRPSQRVSFINSDPRLVTLFLRFLRVAGVPDESLAFRVSIHESADVGAAERFWPGVTRAPATQFRRASLKRHRPNPARRNTGSDYHGCLRIDVLGGARLYHQIEGWCDAIFEVGQKPPKAEPAFCGWTARCAQRLVVTTPGGGSGWPGRESDRYRVSEP